MTIDPHAAVPVYRQLAAILAGRISSGELPAGRAMPSETTLRQEFGVARGTARKAVAVLREAGLVVTVTGKGSFVVDRPVNPGGGAGVPTDC